MEEAIAMRMSHLDYLPLSPLFFLIVAAAFAVLAAAIAAGVLRYAYRHLGLGPGGALLVLLGSLLGSYVNLPVAELPARRVLSDREVVFFGMHYIVPLAVNWPGTIVAVNVGGCLVPVVLSIYLLTRIASWLRAAVAVLCVTFVCHALAQPVPGIGIAVPIFVPPAAAAFVSLLLAWRDAAPLAYVSGSLGTLIGADLLNLDRVQGLGAPVASIGGAGTFDGIFLSGLIAVLLASIPGWIGEPTPRARPRW
jgi:uncharacterized membrane protein